MATEEGTLPVQAATLYTKTWKTQGEPRAILAFIHGFSDHSNAYYDLFPTLARRGIQVQSFDQRGWGRSVNKPQERGRTGPSAVVMGDIHSFLLTRKEEKVPLFLMGHSMGGAEVLYYTLHPESPFTSKDSPIRGVMAYSPLIALHPSTRPSGLVVSLGRLAGKIAPRWQRHSPLDPRAMSRDDQVCAEWAADALCHDYGTLEGLAGMLDRGLWLESRASASASANTVPRKEVFNFWFGHGTDDKVTDYEATRRLAAALGEEGHAVTFQSYRGGYHKLHADLEAVRTQFAQDIGDWILERVDMPARTEDRTEDRAKL
ncbi:hypothetical protein ASPZODRAFT_140229 [Penicilliopsis zonata CBS 506.65]|uniref:Serine aminopeptidase S33 domain-containing protein n=1 Tax=Penicilliopsis zonata CBS 506.65 TaxID=1073090 RepID=A0A1L9SQG5_9EURO|nr:hypothetical protein ASPZODRAFT_140229 [Penicilliopsis zonata CBS 506.65]OJJ49321.1 hypothetical protein ASPZODRAFT_140229 [Penicilliopsis zonata CBS 506.65]